MNTYHNFDPNLELLGYPFDQYQRYQDARIIVDIIQAYLGDISLKILDVGGTPVANKFLGDHNIVTANPEIESGILLQSDGTRLPFSDQNFDVTMTIDTLEHVPTPAQRQALIEEILRMTKYYAIIIGPFSNGYNEFSEATLHDFMVEMLGTEHRFLAEHLQNGLPDLDDCLKWVSEESNSYITVPSGYIYHWLPLMIIKHYLVRLAKGGAISEELDRLYNYQCYWSDHRLPSYRQIVVVSKSGDTDALANIEQVFDQAENTPPTIDLNGVMAMWQALGFLKHIEERDDEINRLRAEVERQQVWIENVKSGRFMRLMAVIHQIKELFR